MSNWQTYTSEKQIKLTSSSDYVQFKNTTVDTSTDVGYFRIIFGKTKALGNIQSLLNYSTNCHQYCYSGMFAGCSYLVNAPELPATNLAKNCYSYMFAGCSYLVNAPELPATTLAANCYSGMFASCTSLTIAPELPATTLINSCYSGMFASCTSLQYIKVGFTNWQESLYATNNWVPEVSSTGTFVCPAALPKTHGISFIPERLDH